MLSSKDVNFVGYTYKNFEIVQDANVPGVGELLNVKLGFCFPSVVGEYFADFQALGKFRFRSCPPPVHYS